MAKTMQSTRYHGVYRDKNNAIFYQFNLGKDENGNYPKKKRRVDKNGKPFETEKEAYEEMLRVKQEYKAVAGKATYALTYKVFMEQQFIPMYKGEVEESTFLNRKNTFEKLIKRFGDKKLIDITTKDCETYRTWLLSKSGFSKSYASLIYGTLRRSLSYAVQLDILNKNVSLKTKSIGKSKQKTEIWDKSEFEKVISKMCTKKYYGHLEFILIWLYYMTGVRVSEGLALTWKDIDFEKGKLKVTHTIQFKKRHDYHIKPYTKTKSGSRTIMLDKNTLSILEQWKIRQAKHCESDLILSYDGQPLHRSTVSRIIKRYAKLAGVPEISGKALRHSHVSYLINEFNADVLMVSRRLGHSSPEITLKYYAHLWPRNDEWIVQQMAKNIKVKLSNKPLVDFIGNANVRN